MDFRVKAIREDALVGRGTCTYIDETFSDTELVIWVDDASATTPKEAVEWARSYEGLKIEMAVECEAPTAMARLNEWEVSLDKYPITC